MEQMRVGYHKARFKEGREASLVEKLSRGEWIAASDWRLLSQHEQHVAKNPVCRPALLAN